MIDSPDIPQHMRAMARGNAIRLARAELRRTVAAEPRPGGLLRVCELLEDPPDVIETLEVFDLLRWVHRVGGNYARGVLRRADPFGPINETKQVGSLTERQRHALAQHLRDAAAALRGGAC